MEATSKYLIHADIRANGVVERSDVVGAIFGQTEGLLGEELDLRTLQRTSKLGRIDVEIESEGGTSFGRVTIASGLDQVETAVLAAALETLTRVGPCRATLEVTEIEDVRAAKRNRVVDRATELLGTAFDDASMTTDELIEEVRRNIRVADVTEYEGFPAGPRVADGDAVIVVEGRSDVVTLLRYGIKNAVAVEGTNVPDEIAALTHERTTTTFLDGDRGGDLILKELMQVGDVDYVAFAPAGKSVEDLTRQEVTTALRDKTPAERVADTSEPHAVVHDEAESVSDDDPPMAEEDVQAAVEDVQAAVEDAQAAVEDAAVDGASSGTLDTDESDTDSSAENDADPERSSTADDRPTTLRSHVREVIEAELDAVRLLDETYDTVSEDAAAGAFDAVVDAESVPHAVVVDGEVTQRLLDVAAQRGVEHLVGRSTGEFTKQPASVRVLVADELASEA